MPFIADYEFIVREYADPKLFIETVSKMLENGYVCVGFTYTSTRSEAIFARPRKI